MFQQGAPTHDGRKAMVSGRLVPTMVLGSSAMTTTTEGRGTNRTTIHTTTIKHPLCTMPPTKQQGVGNRSNFSRRHHTRVNEIGSRSECNSECSVTSDLKDPLEEEE